MTRRLWRHATREACSRLSLVLGAFVLLGVVSCQPTEALRPPTPTTPSALLDPLETAQPKAASDAGRPAKALSARALVPWLQTSEAPMLVDVRSASACQVQRIPGALCIPVGELEARLAELPRDKPIVVYGRGYGASGEDEDAEATAAARLLIEKGYSAVYQLEGGLAAYLRVLQELTSPG